MRENEDDKRNNGEWFRNNVICGYKPPSLEMFYLHRRNCISCKEKAILEEEFVKCPKCEYASSNIKRHLNKVHNLTNLQIEKNNIITCSEKYKTKMGNAVSKAIQDSPIEIKRRSDMLSSLNKRQDFRERASKTAKITSSRNDIVTQRTDRLKTWREENPEKFKNKCWKKMISSRKKWKKSKPEIFMNSWLDSKYPDTFEWGKMLRSKEFSKIGKSDRKQIDFRSKNKNIFIEIDGPFHFKNLSRKEENHSEIIEEAIERARNRDEILEKIIKQKNKTLIRIGYGSWKNRSGEINQELLQKVSQIIEQKLIGIFKFGEVYGENNCL